MKCRSARQQHRACHPSSTTNDQDLACMAFVLMGLSDETAQKMKRIEFLRIHVFFIESILKTTTKKGIHNEFAFVLLPRNLFFCSSRIA
jgi:hypothetical protein